MRYPATILLLLLLTVPAAASRRRAVHPLPSPSLPTLALAFDFRDGSTLGWEAGFADYSPHTDMQTTGELRRLPPEIGSATAWFLSGWNHSDDLFMFLRRRLTAADGIRAHQNYIATFRLTWATNAGPDCGGIGGAPGESVYIKAGLAPVRPEPVLLQDYLRMNIDKGNQSQDGMHATVVGNMAADRPLPCSADAPYVTMVREHTHPHAVAASADGELWLLFGTDSGFEGYNSVYVQKIEVTLEPVAANDPRARWQKTYAEIFSIVEALAQAGANPIELDRHRVDLIGGRALVFQTGTAGDLEELYFYVFDTEEETSLGQSLISPDGSRIDGIDMNWISPPHFFRGDHFLVNYVGRSDTVLTILSQRLGEPFAGP
ncbi:MAG TPA: hypothetical protein VM779_15120 [Thermoanaerobaculia bacterium]|nr:hypothetical protein [Thermoanaerobaculia bacterium]